MEIVLKQVFVGLPKTMGRKDTANLMEREWTSGIFKEPVEEAVWVGKTGLAGDGQGDLEHHGGPDKAVCAYTAESYQFWQTEQGLSQLTGGAMGENFLLEHLTEELVSIGDTYSIGDAIVQVSQPRQPCWKPARRFGIKKLALFLQETGRTGWYFRVLKEGHVAKGQTFTLVDRPFPEWTIQTVNGIIFAKHQDYDQVEQLAQCDLLASSLRATLEKRLENRGTLDFRSRLYGPNE